MNKVHVQYRHIIATLFIFNESTVLLTDTANHPTVPPTTKL